MNVIPAAQIGDIRTPELRFVERLSARGVKFDIDTETAVLAAFQETLAETLADPPLAEAVPWSPDEEEEIRAGLEAAHQDILAGNYTDVDGLREYLRSRREARRRGNPEGRP